MNRNSKSHFSATDNRINIGRSRFDRSSWWKGTMNTGDLVPFYVDEVLPGDTFDMKTSVLCRMSTPIFPVMDNAYLDTYFFFTPSRLVWDHFKQFMGENDVNSWTSSVDYEIPRGGLTGRMLNPDGYAFTLVDYMGLPIPDVDVQGIDGSTFSVNILPFRAYQLIWNEWFRDQNLQDPVLIDKGDFNGILQNSNLGNNRDIIALRRVNKFHDYFTSCLPAPQKGNAVLIPGFDGSVPVITSHVDHSSGPAALHFKGLSGSGDVHLNGLGYLTGVSGSAMSGEVALIPNNLYVGTSSGVTIDSLRAAFQVQKLLWRDANGGSRYTEIIRSHFGVVSPDARLQRPEYLGGKRIPITVNQVIQQSSTDDVSPQGNTAAVSKTVDSFNGFTKSFTEHGYVIGVCCIRTDHTYQNGINRMWSRRDRLDFYFPEFAHLGEQAVLNQELFAAYDLYGSDDNEKVFGYQEAWAEYKMRPSYVTGAFRSNYPESLDAWHYADDYPSLPSLSSEWIQEPIENVNRTLAVQADSNNHSQWLLDFYFDLKCTRPMPMYSVPGLVDHF